MPRSLIGRAFTLYGAAVLESASVSHRVSLKAEMVTRITPGYLPNSYLEHEILKHLIGP